VGGYFQAISSGWQRGTTAAFAKIEEYRTAGGVFMNYDLYRLYQRTVLP
jgi:hypothetical protein